MNSHPYPASPTQVIFTEGTDYQIGRQHAEQVGDAANRGMVEFYYSFWKRMIAFKASQPWEKPFVGMLRYLMDSVLVGKLVRQIPKDAMDRLKGLSDVSGRPLDELCTTLVLPDLMPLLEVYLAKFKPGMFLRVFPPPQFGCSSFVSSGKHYLVGRNLDFPGVGYWDRYPVIQSTKRPYGMKYLGITTAGAPFCGITGINEAQISVSLHQHYCREGDYKGRLPFVIGEEILCHADSLEKALAILKSSRVSASWAFIVTDGKTRKGFLYECHPKAAGYQAFDGGFAHANFFQTPECQPAELATTVRMNWDNFSRRDRLLSLLKHYGPNLTPEQATQMISDHHDPYWGEEKILNRTVSQVYNIQSLVLDPEAMKLYLAEGDAPVHLGHYQEYDLGEIFAGREGRTSKRLPAYHFADEKKKEAKKHYILSFVAAFDGNESLALERLEKSMDSDFIPEAALVAGVLLLKRGDFPAALQRFQRGASWIEKKAQDKGRKVFPPEYFELGLFTARTLDLLGRRAEAVAEYERVASHEGLQDGRVKDLCQVKKPFHKKRLGRILMPYSSYIPME